MRPGAADDQPLTELPRRVPSTDGVELVVHDLGGDGPPVLLCHATGFHGRVWLPLAADLPYRAYAPDLRGHGDSTAPAGDLAWSGFGEDVLAVVDALGLTDVLAVGHSKGGAALLLAEQSRPGTFRALYCYEPVVFPTLPDTVSRANPLAQGALRRRPTFPSVEAAIENYSAKPPFDALAPAALDAYVRYGFAPDPEGIRLKCRPEIESQVYLMGNQHGAFDRLGEVRCPVTVAVGEVVPFGPAAVAEAVASRLPNGRLEEHPDLGHFGPLEDPARIAARISGFFSTC